MSANHKRPLFAFVLVALACSVIMANGIRSQAVVAVLRASAQQVVAGVELVVTEPPEPVVSADPEPELTPVGSVEVAAQQVFGGGRSVSPAGHRTTRKLHAKALHAHANHAHANHAHARSPVKQHGHAAPDRAHGKSHHQKPGKVPGKKHGKKLGKVKVHAKDHAQSNGHGHAKGNKHQGRDD